MTKKLTLSDVKKRIVSIEVKNPASGFELEIEIELPSISDWNNALLGIELPSAPTRQRMIKGQKEDYTDFNDPEFRAKQNEAFEMLAMRRVTQALLGAGNFPELKGKSLEVATNELMQNADRSILQAISQALSELMNGTKGGVESKKANFRTDTVSNDSDEDMSS